MGAGEDFSVTTSKKEVVAAVLPMQEHWLPQSNLDLLLPPVDFSVFFCYKRPAGAASKQHNFATMVSLLKKSLAQALVSYYAFAGEVVQNSVGEPELLCNNRGVDFVEAFADVELRELNLYNPDQSVEGKLVLNKKQGVLAVQATELKCGGIVVACTFDHRVADAHSANRFLVTWADAAHSKPISLKPTFRRSLLNPRRPGRYDASVADMYVPISALPPPKPGSDHLISRMYYISDDRLSSLQSLASAGGGGGGKKRSKLESFSAFLWKAVAESAAEGDADKRICKLGIVVDGRTRLADGDGHKTALMESYFGNVLSIPFGGHPIEELRERPLSWVADSVHEFLESAVTKEHFLGLIDWVEARRPEPALAKIYCNGSEDGPALVVSSGQRFTAAKMDFGWGAPALGSYHFPWGGESGYVMPMPSPTREGDWVVYVHLLKKQLEAIEKKASHIFAPMTSDYLELNKF